jgi:hypothetical protein
MKICTKCNKEKESNSLNFRICIYPSGKEYFKAICRECECFSSKKYNKDHKEERKEYSKKFHLEINPNYKKQWKVDNKDKINQNFRDKLASDNILKLRRNCSRAINYTLKSQNSSKQGYSILKFLPYTLEELKDHLENKFDNNMNWKNYGTYWHLDHIMPQSDLPFASMEEENFKICWSLANLRPLEAKQNMSDGARRTRHKKRYY